ncbi:MAG: hypothetical protein ACI9FW_001294 [Flavobacterium sp.]|jgi:hypothetical protein
MTILKKKNALKTTEMIVDDIKYSFYKLTQQSNPILSITINNTGCKTKEELRFLLTNKFFNKIHKDYQEIFETTLNYLFVIEYPTKVSMGNQIPNNCNVHVHIILETTIPEKNIESYILTTFKNPNIYIEDITQRNDKLNYVNYLIKQKDIFNIDSYNYKIKI